MYQITLFFKGACTFLQSSSWYMQPIRINEYNSHSSTILVCRFKAKEQIEHNNKLLGSDSAKKTILYIFTKDIFLHFFSSYIETAK